MGILLQGTKNIKTDSFKDSFIKPPSPAGAEFCTLVVDFVDKTGTHVHVVFDSLEIKKQLKACVSVALEL